MERAGVNSNSKFAKELIDSFLKLHKPRIDRNVIVNNPHERKKWWREGKNGYALGNNAVKTLKCARNLHTLRVRHTIGEFICDVTQNSTACFLQGTLTFSNTILIVWY